MSDPHWTWGDRFILLRQDTNSSNSLKIRMNYTQGWAAYIDEGILFVKFFDMGGNYNHPDPNSDLETWTNQDLLELVTLGPNQIIMPGETISHLEDLFLFQSIASPENDCAVVKNRLPLIQACQEFINTRLS